MSHDLFLFGGLVGCAWLSSAALFSSWDSLRPELPCVPLVHHGGLVVSRRLRPCRVQEPTAHAGAVDRKANGGHPSLVL